MVFNYGDAYQAFQGDELPRDVPTAFFSGQFTSNFHLILKGNVRIAGVVFKPSAINNLFGIRMSTLVNSRMLLNYALAEKATDLHNQIGSAKSDQVRADILFTFLSDKLKEINYTPTLTDQAVAIIDQNKGNIAVNEVAEKLGVSQRSLEKWFLEKVGLSPKFYARIKRFSVLSNIVAHKEKVDWQEVLVEAGFHDQSHLIKEYLDFNKMNPSTYHEKHTEAIRYINKK
jgi:AraC-like DNA-binding protein